MPSPAPPRILFSREANDLQAWISALKNGNLEPRPHGHVVVGVIRVEIIEVRVESRAYGKRAFRRRFTEFPIERGGEIQDIAVGVFIARGSSRSEERRVGKECRSRW